MLFCSSLYKVGGAQRVVIIGLSDKTLSTSPPVNRLMPWTKTPAPCAQGAKTDDQALLAHPVSAMFQWTSSGVRSSQYFPATESQLAYSMVCGTILGAPVVPDVKKICIRSEFLLLLGSSDPTRCAFWASWLVVN